MDPFVRLGYSLNDALRKSGTSLEVLVSKLTTSKKNGVTFNGFNKTIWGYMTAGFVVPGLKLFNAFCEEFPSFGEQFSNLFKPLIPDLEEGKKVDFETLAPFLPGLPAGFKEADFEKLLTFLTLPQKQLSTTLKALLENEIVFLSPFLHTHIVEALTRFNSKTS